MTLRSRFSPPARLVRLLQSCRQLYLRIPSPVRLIVKCAVLFTLFFLLANERLDPDFGWHLQAGNYIRAHGIPNHDVFTYTASNFPWIDHEWGNDVIVSLVYQLGSYRLVAALFALLWTTAFMVIGRRSSILGLLVAFIGVSPNAGIRPIAWTCLLLVLLLCCLETKRKRWLWMLPPLFVLWANLHGSFVIGLGVVGYYGLFRRRPALFGWLLVCILATFCNPYGPTLYVEIARTLFDPALKHEITEWMPFNISTLSLFFIMIWLGGFWLFQRKKLTNWFSLSVLFVLATVSAVRNMPLFVIFALKDLGGFEAKVRAMIPRDLDFGRRVCVTVLRLALGATILVGLHTVYWPLVNREAISPISQVAYLQKNGCDGGNLFNAYGIGGYLIWKLPSQKVFIDGRMPSWKDEHGKTYLSQYSAIMDTGNYQKAFQKYNIRCVIVNNRGNPIKLVKNLKKHNWTTAVFNPYEILLLAPKH